MKQQAKKDRIPTFASEAQEAEWWYRNRRRLDKKLVEAAHAGKLKVLDRKTLRDRIARPKAAKIVSLRLAESDLELARSQAAKQGLPYQTYIKSLLHQALEQEIKTVSIAAGPKQSRGGR